MPTIDETIKSITNSSGWDQRIARIRNIALNHGTNVHSDINATLAPEIYDPQ